MKLFVFYFETESALTGAQCASQVQMILRALAPPSQLICFVLRPEPPYSLFRLTHQLTSSGSPIPRQKQTAAVQF